MLSSEGTVFSLAAIYRSRVEWTESMTQPGPSGTHSSWTCTDVLAHLYEFIDGALSADAEAEIRRHVEACGCCRPSLEREREFLEMVARRCKTEPCPDELRRRIQEAVEGKRGPERGSA
jgi:anti-sigma factor (TIGR02949 family)